MKTLDQSHELKAELIERFRKESNYVNDDFYNKLYSCTIIFNTRMRSVIGRAKYRSNEVLLNVRLLTAYPEQFNDTLAHELAHIITFNYHGPKTFSRPHGLEWQSVMRMLGYSPERTHKCNLVNAGVKRHTHKIIAYATCLCERDIPLKKHRYMMIASGMVSYRCRVCKSNIKIKDRLMG